ncbi:MAG: DUF4446 family protein [Clostridia bacterium]|nr:DUF4446 family protein [Clostridia bacterium]
MEKFLEFIRTDLFLIILLVGILLVFILYIMSIIKLNKIKKEYKSFMKKIGNGNDLEEILNKHIERINKTIAKNDELEKYCLKIDADIKHCVQKVGLYRYNAYKDTGSDLSFTLALLDEKNDGVVLNGIYSREMSNIYAKPIQSGESTYKITDEEKEAIKRAIN